ncbi:MAG: tRNA (adenosine(37)-N6)-threonylcarbamoyltransferase complex dimerization subunit type 1 TsaB, partial [Rhodobacterales bacterium]|nr:tRNA (adenosine(37)-N6)-threonylcarbamoyltransferase complex dimerization subunit type 1 TsaB [Rhodobacterales bacterium]
MHRSATLLALDSATGACSAAVRAGGALVAHRFQAMARGQAEALMPMAAEVLAEAGLTATDLDGVAVTRGPGAFTGLRIGLSAARGLALAAGVPCLGVTTFQALAEAVPDAELAAGGV